RLIAAGELLAPPDRRGQGFVVPNIHGARSPPSDSGGAPSAETTLLSKWRNPMIGRTMRRTVSAAPVPATSHSTGADQGRATAPRHAGVSTSTDDCAPPPLRC